MSDYQTSPDYWDRNVLETVLENCSFRLLSDMDRQAYAGAGRNCLIAEPEGENVQILLEEGVFNVFGVNGLDETWCLSFTQNGDDEGELIC